MKRLETKKVRFTLIALLILFTISILSGIYLFLNAPRPQNFTLVKQLGTVQFKSTETAQYSELVNQEIDLGSGAYVKTDKDSLAYVYLPDNSVISLDPETELQIQVQSDNVDINQFVGNTWHRVKTVTKGNDYQVKTPSTVASVRGTVFSVDVDEDGNSMLMVKESTVNVRYCDKNKNMYIPQNKMSQVLKNKNCDILSGDIPELLKESNWFKRHNKIDDIYSKLDETNLRSRLLEAIKEDKIDFTVDAGGKFPTKFRKYLQAPEIQIVNPDKDPFETTADKYDIEGKFEFSLNYKTTINGNDVILKDKVFKGVVDLKEGENEITIEAINPISKLKSSKKIKIVRVKPAAIQNPTITLSASSDAGGIKVSWKTVDISAGSNFYLFHSTDTGSLYATANGQLVTGTPGQIHIPIANGQTYYLALCLLDSNNYCSVYGNIVTTQTYVPNVSLSLAAVGKRIPNQVIWNVSSPIDFGFVVLWSKNPNPSYGNSYSQTLGSGVNTTILTANDGRGNYYARVCVLNHNVGTCLPYSNEIQILLQ